MPIVPFVDTCEETKQLMANVLGIGGSPRKGGNSDILLGSLLQGARDAGSATETVYLRDYAFQSCIGCERCREDERCIQSAP